MEQDARRKTIEAGTRRCTRCDSMIDEARLEVMPDAKTCVACARKHPAKLDTRHIELSEASPINRNGFARSD